MAKRSDVWAKKERSMVRALAAADGEDPRYRRPDVGTIAALQFDGITASFAAEAKYTAGDNWTSIKAPWRQIQQIAKKEGKQPILLLAKANEGEIAVLPLKHLCYLCECERRVAAMAQELAALKETAATVQAEAVPDEWYDGRRRAMQHLDYAKESIRKAKKELGEAG